MKEVGAARALEQSPSMVPNTLRGRDMISRGREAGHS